MKILKQENWWVWLLLTIFSSGSSTLVLGALLDTFNKKAWYAKWYYWVIGLVTIVPFAIMAIIFYIQIMCLTASKLEVSGKELYLSPYIWLLCVILPVVGWIVGIIMIVYIQVDILYRLYLGNGKKYV